LTRQQYFDGLAIVRSQDNYVVQWGDPSAGGEAAREFGAAASTLEPEFVVQRAGLALNVLNSRDAYSEEVGFVDGFPVGTDGDNAWLAHCYGMLGVGRGNDIASGSGAELYVVIGHAPRHLDRNVTLIGKAIYGLDHLSTLPRGSGALGFYETPVEMTTISSVRFGDSMAQAEQIEIELLRTDTDTFDQLIDARRNRREAWFHDSVGVIGLCNVPLPVRVLQ
jgi:peptidylprolyl isomerase